MTRRIVALIWVVSVSVGFVVHADEAEQIEQLRQAAQRDVQQRTEKIDLGLLKLQQDFTSDDPSVRNKAIGSILSSNDRRLIPVNTVLLKDPAPYNRKQAVLALHRLKAEGVGDEVGELLLDPELEVRHVAAEYGTQLGYQSNVEEVEKFLTGVDFTSQSAAMHLTRTLPETEAVPILASFLDHESHHLRKRAVQRLAKHDGKIVQPYAVQLLKLAGDSDTWVRNAVREEEDKLLNLVTIDQLRDLSKDESKTVQLAALHWLSEKGQDIFMHTTPFLTDDDPELRAEALRIFLDAGEGPEDEIVALLSDRDSRVKSYALYATQRLKLRSAIPKLRKIFSSGEWSHRRYAAHGLLDMNESVWPAAPAPPAAAGPVFDAVADIALGNEKAWTILLEQVDALTDSVAQVERFPCDRTKLPDAKAAKGYPVMKDGGGRIEQKRCLSGDLPSRVTDAVLVHHGDLVINGLIINGIVIVTGNLYVHDGYIRDSIVLVQGKIISNGYVYNSIVAAGEKETLTVADGYIYDSVAAAHEIACDGYIADSLFSGTATNPRDRQPDLRNSSQIDGEVVYGKLRAKH